MATPVDFDETSVPSRCSGAVEAEVDGELILLSPNDFTYFGAQGSGGHVWELVDGQRTVGEIIDALVVNFEGDPLAIRSDTLDFLDALRAAGLVEFG
jgi:hypothetical protein